MSKWTPEPEPIKVFFQEVFCMDLSFLGLQGNFPAVLELHSFFSFFFNLMPSPSFSFQILAKFGSGSGLCGSLQALFVSVHLCVCT